MAEKLTLEAYLENYWEQAKVRPRLSRWGNARNLLMHIGRVPLPHPTVSPNHAYFAGTQYYWDSYFTIIGLIDSRRAGMARAMVDNQIFLFRKFGFMPARNSITSIGRTQPPFFTRMAWEVYEAGAADESWLDHAMAIAVKEYEYVWQHKRRRHRDSGLSRYRPWVLRKFLTVYESGWDVSTRFALGRTSCLPVDLNSLLYTYEKDIAAWHQLRGNKAAAKVWEKKARERAKAITTYFWDDHEGFFYDFDEKTDSRDTLATLAGFFPMWAGAATKAQAAASVKKVKLFLQPHGLACTEKMAWKHRQWDYPNGWPPLQLIVIEGLLNYGYEKEALEIARRWLTLHQTVFDKTGKLWEKYDVVKGKKGKRGRYPTQEGFSWTNGVYLRLSKYLADRPY